MSAFFNVCMLHDVMILWNFFCLFHGLCRGPGHHHLPPLSNFFSLFLKGRVVCCEELHLSKVVNFVHDMVLFEGKCASCGVSRNHKNFKGRRSGYTIPDPCYIELRKRRKAIDDGICLNIAPKFPRTQ